MPMKREEIDAFLADPRLCHFATVDAQGRPRVRPLWYLWRDGAFYLTTRLEARHTGRDLKQRDQVALSIASEDRPYGAVVAHGRIEILGKDEAVLRDVSSRYGEESARRWLSHALEEDDRVAMRLVPETLLSWDYSREGTDSPKRTRV
jgi:nitroimidazol reductase NimA-like FMN-containing flavoprotein (pyridoxamine 5'-phosphate oxidase superfamily)